MKKRQLRKEIKFGSLILCIVVIGALITLSHTKYKNPGFDETNVSLYSYQSQEKVNYQVSLIPNSLYATKSLGEDQVYLSGLVDTIDTTFAYGFTGERTANIKGSYEIHAVLEGDSGEGDKLTALWKKEIPLVAKTNFEATDKNYSLTKAIPLKLSNFNDLAKKISDESKVNAQTKVTISMNVALTATTDKGVIEKNSTSSLEVPLTTNYFKILKTQSESKPEAIGEVQKVQKPINIELLAMCGVGIGIGIVALLFLLLGTKNLEVNQFRKELKKIFKKHGTRLVALDTEIAVASELQCKVHSMEDLVRISDELGKPIIYKYSAQYTENNAKFWVSDDDKFYVFALELAGFRKYSFKEQVNATM